MAQVFQYPYVCVCARARACVKIYIIDAPSGKRKKDQKNDGVDNLKPSARWPTQAQSYGLALEACASRRRSKMRLAAINTSRADFGSWGMS
jgi:hypothetical protein